MLPAGKGAKKRSKHTSTSSSSKSGSKSRAAQSTQEWTNWEWDHQRQRLRRARQLRDGKWEYQYRHQEPDILSEERTEPGNPEWNRNDSSESPRPTYVTASGQGQSYSVPEHLQPNPRLQTAPAYSYPRPPWTVPSYYASNGLGPRTFNPNAQPQQSNYPYENNSFNSSAQLQQPNFSCEGGTYGPSPGLQQPSISPVYMSSDINVPPQRTSTFSLDPQSQQVRNSTERSTSSFGALALNTSLSWRQPEPEYISITKPENWFKPGRIFSTTSVDAQNACNDVRTFVVMREGIGFSECCLLRPYSPNAFGNNYGVQSRALVFANGTTPELLPGEVEPGMGQFPVIIEKPTETFDSTLRLDFSEVYKIEHNVKVRNVGRIDRKHLKLLNSAFLEATEASQPEIDSQWAGFGNNNDWLYKARRSQGYSYDSPMNDRMAAPAVGPFARPGFPDDGARGFNYNTQKVDNVARGNFNTQTLNNMAMPTAGPFARSGSPNNDARSLATSTALSPDYDDPYVSGSQTGLLHRDYKICPSKDFRFGKVFKILWTEPKGQGNGDGYGTDYETMPIKYGQDAYASIRRFVVVKQNQGHCLCLPILTYGLQGTTKRGVKPQDHAIIFVNKDGKAPEELKGESKLSKKAIRVAPLGRRDVLDPASRLNYAKIYTVEYNVKVCFIGEIHKTSVKYFVRDYNAQHQPLPEDNDVEFSDE